MKFVITLIICSITIFTQSKTSYSSHEGRLFYVGFMQNEVYFSGPFSDQQLAQKLFIASKFDNEIIIEYGGNSRKKIVEAGSVITEDFVRSKFEIRESHNFYNDEIIKVTSRQPITLYGYSSYRMSSDIFTVIPVKNYGYDYYVSTLGNDYYSDTRDSFFQMNIADSIPRTGQFLIIAQEDNTLIDIKLTANTEFYDKGDEFSFRLDKGQAYFVQGLATRNRKENDLSGTRISSDKPIGVISGHMRSGVVQTDQFYQSKDNLIEMLFPTDSWGKTYISIDFLDYMGSMYKVTAKDPNTYVDILKANGEIQREWFYTEGFTKELLIEGNVIWRSNNSIQIAQYMARVSPQVNNADLFYDPAMVILNPIETYINQMFFRTLGNNEANWNIVVNNINYDQYEDHYIQLIMDEDAINDITVDGRRPFGIQNILNQPYEINGKEYFFSNFRLDPGTHNIKSSDGKFTGVHFGVGPFDSYAHSLGTGFSTATNEDQEQPIITNVDYECGEFLVTVSDLGENQLGIYEIDIFEQENINIKNPWDGDDFIQNFEAEVINLREDATIKMNAVDFAGNQTLNSFTYSFPGYKYNIQYPDLEIGRSALKTFVLGDIFEDELIITNTGSRDLVIENIDIPEFFEHSGFSNTITQGSELIISATINTNNYPNDPRDEVFIDFGCGVSETFNLGYDVQSANAMATGYNFPDTYLKETRNGNVFYRNTEDTQVLINDIKFGESSVFDFEDVSNTFLAKGEQLNIPVDFSPISRTTSSVDVVFSATAQIDQQSIDLSRTITVTGRGIAPEINSVEWDFGRLRAGQRVVKTLEFQNTGNVAGALDFLSFDNDINSYSQNTKNRLENINSSLDISASSLFQFVFEPTSSGSFNLNGNLETDWAHHEEITFRTIGEAYNDDVLCLDDTTRVTRYSDHDLTIYQNQSTYDIFISDINMGTVTFTNLDGLEMRIEPGDADYPFQLINTSDLSTTYTLNDEFDVSIVFSPYQVGNFRVGLDIVHNILDVDNSDESQTMSSFVCINSRSIEELSLSSNLDIPLHLNCVENESALTIENTGELALEVRDVQIIPEDADFNFDVSTELPFILAVNEIRSFSTDHIFTKKDDFIVDYFVSAYNSDLDTNISVEGNTELETQSMSLDLDEDVFTTTIGSDSLLTFTGRFPYVTDIDADYSIEINFDWKIIQPLFDDLNQIIKVSLYKDENEEKIDISAQLINDTTIVLNLDDVEFDLNNGLEWRFGIQFFTFFNLNTETDITVTFRSDNCFSSIVRTYTVDIEEVCIHRYIAIDLLNEDVQFAYNQKSRNISVEYKTVKDDLIHFKILNVLGESVKNFEEKFVYKGNHLLYYDLSDLPSGKYFLSFETSLQKYFDIIIISK